MPPILDNPIVVTGLGAVSPFGLGRDVFWRSLIAGADALRPLDRFDTEGYRFKTGGQVPFDDNELGHSDLDLAHRFAFFAVDEAMKQSGFSDGLGSVDPARFAAVGATNFGGVATGEGLARDVLANERPFDRARYDESSGAALAHRLGDRYGLRGPRLVQSLSCASGNAALETAWRMARAGRIDAAIVIGYDALNAFCWSGLSALRTMTTDTVRPFDAKRNGTLFSEGAGALVVETLASAKRRGAKPLAELAGCATDNNAFHMTAPDKGGEGQVTAARRAMRDGGVDPGTVDHVNMHGTGTKYNDSTETAVFKTVLGRRAREIPFTSIKSMIGHTMGAASALEAIASILTMREGVVPPTIHYNEPDPECDLDYCTGGPRKGDYGVVVNNASGIGGCNSIIVLRRRPLAEEAGS